MINSTKISPSQGSPIIPYQAHKLNFQAGTCDDNFTLVIKNTNQFNQTKLK